MPETAIERARGPEPPESRLTGPGPHVISAHRTGVPVGRVVWLRVSARMLVGLGLVIASFAAPARAEEPRVRVLLYEGPAPVIVDVEASGGHSATRHVIAPGRKGLRVDGVDGRRAWIAPAGRIYSIAGRRVEAPLRAQRVGDLVEVIHEVGLEAYVGATVGREMMTSWAPAALRAQAVATRSYVLHEMARHRDADWDVRATTLSQVYGGLDAAHPAAVRAAADTRGQVLTWEGAPILAAFHSASGGHTASSAEVWGEAMPYLVGRTVDGEDDSPDTYWRARVSRTTLANALAVDGLSVGELRSVEIAERSESGRAHLLRVKGSKGALTLTGKRLRRLLGESTLRSTLFEVRADDGGFLFVGSGSGHGVGMSQWAARAMAVGGADYTEILATFYAGARLDVWSQGQASRVGAAN